MSKYFPCPCACGLKFVTKDFAEKHADEKHEGWRTPKQKGWCTPYGFIDFTEKVTYEKACEVAKELQDKFGKAGE